MSKDWLWVSGLGLVGGIAPLSLSGGLYLGYPFSKRIDKPIDFKKNS
jgi:hypothetical protein